MNALSANPVGRPRSFDENEVLLTAMDVFWLKGYEKTTVADLMRATGLHKGSLYQAFGDKHNLFILALKAYLNNFRQHMQSCLEGSDNALEGIRNAMYYHIGMGLQDDASNTGCMALNSLVEDAQHDDAIMQVLEQTNNTRMTMIIQVVGEAQQTGFLRTDWSADRIANMIATMEAGLMVELKGPLTEDQARGMVDDLLDTLGP